MAVVAYFFILFSGEKGQVLNSVQKHAFNYSLLDVIDFYIQYWGEKSAFTLNKVSFLCFLYGESAGPSKGHFLSYLKLRCIKIYLSFCSCYFFLPLKILI